MSGAIPSRQPSIVSPPPTPSPRRPSALAGGASAEQRRARREQFRSFYGLKGGSGSVNESGLETRTETAEVGGSPKTGDPLDISKLECPCARRSYKLIDIPDSPGFNAAAYYEDLIKKSSLAELMQAAASMSAGKLPVPLPLYVEEHQLMGSDISNLQSSRHSLVYNHHHQVSYPSAVQLSSLDSLFN